MKIMTTEVPSIGHILTANGLKPDPSKVQAVVEEMPSPADKPALLRFLGMVNYIVERTFAQGRGMVLVRKAGESIPIH